ncbi:DNA mismatch repair protein MutS [Ammoniphilus resinae]|uniref:DNA mismatch repair protein MutS n=1 Tax=Ammoniphilus resinae TaxID=861532 RepID=A0ABS4GNE7_9BACL|nr:DNA mismatch repair protein MutS [Ammoniphilus resinae]MBP1931582.1 DNA mismatch repair protein MutS [Ammoniphilus resinae]
MAKYTPMMEQYLSIKAEYPDAFLFFRLGDFYELFFEDAVLAARELEITLTGREAGTEERIPMCGVPYHSVDTYFHTLLAKGYKIAICEQVEDPKTAKGVVRREVIRVLTPGTVMEGNMLSDRENNFLVAGIAEEDGFSLAACDISTGQFYGAVFQTIEQLAAEIMSYNPKEILLKQGTGSITLQERCVAMGSSNIQVITDEQRPTAGLSSQLIDGDLSASLKMASQMLLDYLKDTQKRNLDHLQPLEVYLTEQYMVLDPFTKKNLELMETLIDKSKKGSLLWYLDQTVTALGARMIRSWVDKPLLGKEEIQNRLIAVGFLKDQWMVREELRELLKSVYDIERLAGRISFGNANAKDLVNLKRSLEVIPLLKKLILKAETEAPGLLKQMAETMDGCQDLVELIEQAIVNDPPLSVKEGGLIKEGYDGYLDKLKTVSRDGKQWISALEKKEREETGIKSLKVGYNRVFGYYIEVTKANLGSLPEGKYERKQTLANAERFITPELKEQEALILEAEEKLTELEYQIFSELRQQIARFVTRLQRAAKQIATFDALASLAQVAQECGLVRPTLQDDGVLYIREGRHPVVEKVLVDQPFIANDTHLDCDTQRIVLLTGPNMAGKSTYMRQVALIVIMAQIGSFVPAESATISLTDRIFTRIGAADDLVGGQSTFMVEMKDIETMTTQASKQSLVIIDEIGRGTSTHDGMSIAQAVIEFLHDEVGCKSIVSTHYHELAVLEDMLQGLKNFHMAVQEQKDNIVFLRKLKQGSTSESYGIYCAQLAGLPEKIINRSGELLKGYKEKGPVEQSSGLVNSFVQEPIQLDLFATSSKEKEKTIDTTVKKLEKITQEVKSIDLINMTPLAAMNYLFELKQKLQKL